MPALKKRINDFVLEDDKLLGWLLMPAVRFGEKIQLCKHIMRTPTHTAWDSLHKVMNLCWFKWSRLKDWALMCHYRSSLVFEQYVCSNELAMNASCSLYLLFPFFSNYFLGNTWDWWLRRQCFWGANEHEPLAKPSLSTQLLLEAPAALVILWKRPPCSCSGPGWMGSSGCVCESWIQQVGHKDMVGSWAEQSYGLSRWWEKAH